MIKFPWSILLISCCIFLATGCVNTKKFTYLNDIELKNGTESSNPLQPLRVQPGDVLQITITTIDKDISVLLNPTAAANPGAETGMAQGYIVDNEGNVVLPMTGKVYVKGKTTAEINTIVGQEINKSIRNAYVSTRITNFRISVLGDVARPGSYRIPGERVSILDALSMAGDLNITGVRNDVMVIRDINGSKEYASLNLNDSKILASPYYYLNNNDVVYIKPGPNKSFGTSKFVQLLPAVIGALSLITTLIIVTTK